MSACSSAFSFSAVHRGGVARQGTGYHAQFWQDYVTEEAVVGAKEIGG